MSDVEDVIEVDIAEWKKLKVGELRKRVAELGLENKGTKAELIARVEKYLSEQEEDLLEEVEEVEEEKEESNEVEVVEEQVKAATGQSNGKLAEAVATPATSVVEKQETKTETSEQKPNSNPLPTKLSDSERVLLRGERFGRNESLEAKKAIRAQRFGTTSYEGLGKRSGEDLEKMKKRAQRFGASTSPTITKLEDNEKKVKRLERFGTSASSTLAMGMDERKRRRAERFNS